MRIDWTQTLMGSDAMAHAGSASTGMAGVGPDLAALLAGRRLIGVLTASLAIGLSLATLPFRGLSVVLPEWISLSGALVAAVCGYVLLSQPRPIARIAGLFSGFLALPLAAFAGLDASVIALIAVLAIGVGLSDWLCLEGRGHLARIVAGIPVLATLTCFLQWPLDLAAIAPVVTMAVPLVLAMGRVARPAPAAATPDLRLKRLEAVQAQLLTGANRQVVVVDQVGDLDHAGETAFGRHLIETQFPEGSLMAATLIADRVPLLQALSRAIHDQHTSADLMLRLRRDPAGAGYPMPPRFDSYRCRIAPLPGQPDRATVLIDAAEAAVPMPAPKRIVDAALVSRALHDSVAPFNAGLGFLEMIADPRLAPRDLASWRDYAAEAHKAISEAHRNTHLMGRWLRAGLEGAGETADILPTRLLSDSVRALNLRDSQDKGLFTAEPPASLPVARLPLPASRFAMEILLRRAMAVAGSRLEWLREGADLVVTCCGPDRGEVLPPDAFERALCQALAGEAGIGFVETGRHDLALRFVGAYAGRLPVVPEDRTNGDVNLRAAV
jgi:hypothetical protein